MEFLVRGNELFRQEYYPRFLQVRGESLHEQHPLALYIGCSDSRVPIERITGALPGDLFVLRNMGAIVPPSYYADACLGATIEYAVVDLRVEHAIVCGHYGCGAIAALVRSMTSFADWSLSRSTWLNHARPILTRVGLEPQSTEEERAAALRRLVEENVRLQLANLRTYDCVRAAESAGRLLLHGWTYDWDTGGLFEERDGVFAAMSVEERDGQEPQLHGDDRAQ